MDKKVLNETKQKLLLLLFLNYWFRNYWFSLDADVSFICLGSRAGGEMHSQTARTNMLQCALVAGAGAYLK